MFVIIISNGYLHYMTPAQTYYLINICIVYIQLTSPAVLTYQIIFDLSKNGSIIERTVGTKTGLCSLGSLPYLSYYSLSALSFSLLGVYLSILRDTLLPPHSLPSLSLLVYSRSYLIPGNEQNRRRNNFVFEDIKESRLTRPF